jgi:hypothetical protein
MEMNWEYFEQGPEEEVSGRIYVTINSRGTIFLNRRAVASLGGPDRVVLMYDRRRSVMGIGAASPGQAGAFRLKRKGLNGYGCRLLYASNFCRAFSICPDETLRFTAAEVDKAGVLRLDLNEVRSAKRRR